MWRRSARRLQYLVRRKPSPAKRELEVTLSPPKACSTPFCSGHAIPGTHKCADCSVPSPESTPLTKGRSPFAHLYNLMRWRRPIYGLSDTIIRRDPLCKICNRNASTIADHIRDHRGNLTLFWDPNNLQGICKPCHDKKTGSTHGGGRRAAEPKQVYLTKSGCISEPLC